MYMYIRRWCHVGSLVVHYITPERWGDVRDSDGVMLCRQGELATPGYQ